MGDEVSPKRQKLDEEPADENNELFDVDVGDDGDFQLDDEEMELTTVMPRDALRDEDPMEMNTFKYTIMDPAAVYKAMCEIVEEAHSVIEDVAPSTLRTMLNHVSWNKDKLIATYYDEGEKFMASLNVQARMVGGTTAPDLGNGVTAECEICMESMTDDTSFALSCGHRFCRDCWNSYLEKQITEDGKVKLQMSYVIYRIFRLTSSNLILIKFRARL
jgi:ariadne-1